MSERATAILGLKRLHAILRAASTEVDEMDGDIAVVAIERAGLSIMLGMRMRAIEDAIRRVTNGKEEVL